MCLGIAIPLDDLPCSLHGTPEVSSRLHKRGDFHEVRFHRWNVPAILPVG